MKNFKLQFTASLLCISLALPVFAHTNVYKDDQEKTTNNWLTSKIYMGAYGGYGNVQGAYEDNGEVAFGRLSLGIHVYDYQRFSFGIEAGVQSGNDMILDEGDSIFDATAFMPVQSTLKPLLDLLITLKTQLLPNYPLFGFLKGGIAYRHLQLVDRTSSEDELLDVNGELQVGLGYSITEHAMLTAFYQGIYGGSSAGAELDSQGNVSIDRIPTQQAGFLGLEYTF